MDESDLKILDFVGYQERIKDDDTTTDNAYYLTFNNTNGRISIDVEKTVVDCVLTELEMLERVKTIFTEFPEYYIPKFSGEEYRWEQYKTKWKFPWFRRYNAQERYYFYYNLRVKNQIAKQTRRGAGNTQYGNTLFYKGTSEEDCPIIVLKKGDSYGVLKHPNFEQYGFNLVVGVE